MIIDMLASETRDQLVREAYALGRSKGVSSAVTVKLVQGLVVSVLLPLGLGEEGTERRHGTVGRGDGVERTEIHHVNGVSRGKVGARQSCV